MRVQRHHTSPISLVESLEGRVLFDIGQIVSPVPNYSISAGYGYEVSVGHSKIGNYNLLHAGEDLTAAAGIPVVAIADGVVKFSGSDPAMSATNQGYGHVVVIEHTREDG